MRITTRTQYLELFSSTQEAMAFEDSVLQAGREFLPPCAHAALAGLEPTPDYWTFLAQQFAESSRG